MQPISPNARNWLRAISAAEGTTRDGQVRYNIMFGGGTFSDLSRHPDTVIDGGRYKSAAAGAYQFMPGTWERVARDLGLTDFGPASQDQAALQLMRYRGVDPDTAPINAANVALLAPEWASLPKLDGKSYYDQPVKSLQFVQQAGGSPTTFASVSVEQPAPAQEPQGSPSQDAPSSTDGSTQSGSSNLQTVLSALSGMQADMDRVRMQEKQIFEEGMKSLESSPENGQRYTDDQVKAMVQDAVNRQLYSAPQASIENALKQGIQMGLQGWREGS